MSKRKRFRRIVIEGKSAELNSELSIILFAHKMDIRFGWHVCWCQICICFWDMLRSYLTVETNSGLIQSRVQERENHMEIKCVIE